MTNGYKSIIIGLLKTIENTMKKTIQIRKTVLGCGRPKICVCVTGTDENAIFAQFAHLPQGQFDLIEWRADYFNFINDSQRVYTVLKHVRTQLPDIPILFTCRTHTEGGLCTLAPRPYFHLLKNIIDTQEIDMIDLEITMYSPHFHVLTSFAQQNNIAVIASYHNFNRVPCETQLLHYLDCMQKHGADIAKLAVTPRTSTDLITLLRLSNAYQSAQKSLPLILIGMGELGKITRIGCDLFGSPFTFCAGQTHTAPGQLTTETLYSLFSTLYIKC